MILRVSTVFQYYRSAVNEEGGEKIVVRAVTPDQPPYYEKKLIEGIPKVPGETIKSYNLTWRLESIELTPEAFQRRNRRFSVFKIAKKVEMASKNKETGKMKYSPQIKASLPSELH